MSEKLCVFCKHFKWEYVSPGCPTCGNMNGGMICLAQHYCEVLPYDEDDFREVLLRAESCPDYERPTT